MKRFDLAIFSGCHCQGIHIDWTHGHITQLYGISCASGIFRPASLL